LENTGKIFKDKLQWEKSGNFIKKILETCSTDLKHETSRLKHTHTEENVVWHGRLAKPQRPETNISFNTPDIQRHRSISGRVFRLPTHLLSMI